MIYRFDLIWLIDQEIVRIENNVYVLNKELPVKTIRSFDFKS